MSIDSTTFSARIEHHLSVLNFHGEMHYLFDEALIGVAQAFEIVSASGFIIHVEVCASNFQQRIQTTLFPEVLSSLAGVFAFLR